MRTTMKNVFFAALTLISGSCNVIVPDYTGASVPPRDAKPRVMENPLTAEVRNHAASLLASISEVDAIASGPAFTEEPIAQNASRDSLLATWERDAIRFRALVDAVPADSVPTDSLRRLRIARLDSLSDVVAARKETIAAAGRVEEIKRIEAKLTPAGSFRFQGAQYSAIRVNPADLSMHLHWKNTAGEKYLNIGSLKKDLEKNGDQVVMITNAGMYNPDNSPQGLFIEKGKQLVPLDTAKGPEGQMLNFYLKPNGVFYLDNDGPKVVVTEKFQKNQKGIKFATQSGPMLVIDGKLHPKFTKGSPNTNIRSGVGITKDHQVIFAISDKPVNFYDFATLFRDALGCTDALYLDGAISQMYLPTSKRMDLGGDFGPILAVTKRK